MVAVPHEGSWRGRYVHWSGSPEHLRPVLYEVLTRDGYARAVDVLTSRYWGWSEITAAPAPELREGQRDGRYIAVPGYGIAYTAANGVGPEEWFTPDPANLAAAWIEYAYVLTPDGIASFEVDPAGTATVYREPAR